MRLRVAFCALVALLPFISMSAAQAACPGDAPTDLGSAYRGANVVFKGEVRSTTNNSRTALVEVQEVLKGPDLGGTVEVRGGSSDPQITTANDRAFTVNTRYVFFPANDQAPFDDHACTQTQELTPEVEAQLQAVRTVGSPSAPDSLPRTGRSHIAALFVAGSLLVIAGVCPLARHRTPRQRLGRS